MASSAHIGFARLRFQCIDQGFYTSPNFSAQPKVFGFVGLQHFKAKNRYHKKCHRKFWPQKF